MVDRNPDSFWCHVVTSGMRLVLSVCSSWLIGMLGLLLLKRSCRGIFGISVEILSMILQLKPRDLKKLVNLLERNQ